MRVSSISDRMRTPSSGPPVERKGRSFLLTRADHVFQSDFLWISVLSLLGLLTRIPYVSRILYHWDSVNYALALDVFDIRLHQPQPPGYLFYVLLGRAINGFVKDPQWTYVGISIFSSIALPIMVFLLGKRMFNQRAGLAAGLLTLFSPLVWFYGEIAMPHALDALQMTVLAYLLYRAMEGESGFVFPAALMLGIMGGVRQQSMIFAVPLTMFALYRYPMRKNFAAAVLSVLVFLASFLPTVLLTGGWEAYSNLMSGFSQAYFADTSISMGAGLSGILRNGARVLAFTSYGINLGLMLIAAWLLWRVVKAPRSLLRKETLFLGLWILPCIMFYLLIHMGGHGLVLFFLPGLFLLLGAAWDDLGSEMRPEKGWLWTGLLMLLLLLDVTLFAILPAQPFETGQLELLNRQTLEIRDRSYAARFDFIQEQFDPGETIVLASDWRYVQYYLPSYHALALPASDPDAGPGEGSCYYTFQGEYQELNARELAGLPWLAASKVVFFDPRAVRWVSVQLADRIQYATVDGEALGYLLLEEGEALHFVDSELALP